MRKQERKKTLGIAKYGEMSATGKQQEFLVRGHDRIEKHPRSRRHQIGGTFDDDHGYFEPWGQGQKIIVQD